jgi:hypothetical protein
MRVGFIPPPAKEGEVPGERAGPSTIFETTQITPPTMILEDAPHLRDSHLKCCLLSFSAARRIRSALKHGCGPLLALAFNLLPREGFSESRRYPTLEVHEN